jgi:Replication initiation factor
MHNPTKGSGSTNSRFQKGLFHVKQQETLNSWMVGMDQRENCQQWSVGVDAATLVGLDHKSALVFYNEYETICLDIEVATQREKPWGTHGYKGKSRGPVRVGLKDDRSIISVTGPLATRLVSLSKTVWCKFTRIDLQITCKMDGPVPTLAERLRTSHNLTSLVERGKLWMSYHSSPDGDTLYFNKRTSPSYGRMYDKSRDYAYPLGKVWRFEIELKEELADKIGQIVANAERQEELLADYVASWYADREICVPIGTRGRPSIPETATRVTGVDNTLSWLNKQVAPSLSWLNQAGLKDKAEAALGVQLTFPDDSTERLDF